MMFSETFPIPLCGWNVSSMVEDTGASDKEIVFVLILEQKVSFFKKKSSVLVVEIKIKAVTR